MEVFTCCVSRVLVCGGRKPCTSIVVWKWRRTCSGMSWVRGVVMFSRPFKRKTLVLVGGTTWPETRRSIFQTQCEGLEIRCSLRVSNWGDTERRIRVRTFQKCGLGGLMSIRTGAQQPRDRSGASTSTGSAARLGPLKFRAAFLPCVPGIQISFFL